MPNRDENDIETQEKELEFLSELGFKVNKHFKFCKNIEEVIDFWHKWQKKADKERQEEYQKCFTEEKYSKKIFPMTLEGCVVRISDVIAYIGRDIEDAKTVNLIKQEDIPKEICNILGSKNDDIINTLVLDLIEKTRAEMNVCEAKS